MNDTSDPPRAVRDLQAAYGGPSQEGFGSAVFWLPLAPGGDLDALARAIYREFVGPLWDRYGEAAWMGPWREVYVRHPGTTHDVVAELRGIDDPDAARSASMILDDQEDAAGARVALAAAFDAEGVGPLAAFRLGDGAAMSGLLVAAAIPEAGHAALLVFLMD